MRAVRQASGSVKEGLRSESGGVMQFIEQDHGVKLWAKTDDTSARGLTRALEIFVATASQGTAGKAHGFHQARSRAREVAFHGSRLSPG